MASQLSGRLPQLSRLYALLASISTLDRPFSAFVTLLGRFYEINIVSQPECDYDRDGKEKSIG
jgi:hypothetical protein